MTDKKAKRRSMLDGLTVSPADATTAPLPRASMGLAKPLMSAQTAVDSHKVWDLDPADIIDDRPSDRLDTAGIEALRDSIDASGQTVPILVRRHPTQDGKYLLVYGRRRLEAVRLSDKTHTVRALIASLSDDTAVEAQITENMARQDLSYIEKALFSQELIKNGFGSQTRVAEVLTVPKSAISMALGIVDMVGPDLIRAIGPAHGVGRPRWESLGNAVIQSKADISELILLAGQTRGRAEAAVLESTGEAALPDPSIAAFDAVLKMASPKAGTPLPRSKGTKSDRVISLPQKTKVKVQRTKSGLRLDVGSGAFADWLDAQGETLMADIFTRFAQSRDDES